MMTQVVVLLAAIVLSGCVHQPVAEAPSFAPDVEVQGKMCCIPETEIEAVRSAALGGDVGSMLRMMHHFHLCFYDTQSAVMWARMASAADSTEAKYCLSVMLFWDDADHSNDQEAIDLMREAADRGYENAADLLKDFEKENEANQALQTTSVTRGVFEKVSVFGRQRLGV